MIYRTTILFLMTVLLSGATGPQYAKHFEPQALRIDYYQSGTQTKQLISLEALVLEPLWAGSRTNLLDTLNRGKHQVRVYDAGSGELIYSTGFCSIFSEWMTTDEATAGITRTFPASVRLPLPKNKVIVRFATRNRQNQYVDHYQTEIDPQSRFVIREKPDPRLKPKKILSSGDPANKIDLLILPEGYTKAEMGKFRHTLTHFCQVLFESPPFQENRSKFNVWTLELPAPESGIDDPRANIFTRTNFGLTYNSLDLDRYVLAFDNKSIRSAAMSAPYDYLIFIFNSTKYGGGGIYNLWATCYSDAEEAEQSWWPDYVFVHEFGHSLAGLADEYYASAIVYNEFYPVDVEPWEPNITALLKPATLKWQKFVSSTTPVPTPWQKEQYDAMDPKNAEERGAFLKSQTYWNQVGAFQGAGYASTGLYRPMLDCRMFSKSLTPFCRVCQEAIEQVIRFHTE